MHIKRIHEMIEKVTECANSQLAKGTDCVDTEEMEKVACIIKELAEAEYYSKISKAMDEAGSEEYIYYNDDKRYYNDRRYRDGRYAPKGRGHYVGRRGYEEPYYHMTPEMYENTNWNEILDVQRDMDRRNYGRMYYSDGNSNSRGANEGRSGMSRNRYFDTKMSHNGNSPEDKQAKMRDLEEYMRSLSDDMAEMITDMSAEEKNLLRNKVQNLVTKIV